MLTVIEAKNYKFQGSITENVRRHVQRGGKSHQIESGTSSRLSKSDENFMKFVTTIVQKAFKWINPSIGN